jgi:virulence-associated protein VagC
MTNSESITVFENLSDQVINFESKEQFMRHYDKNKEAIDSMATRGLNTKFKIDGFKIGRKNKQLILYPIKQSIQEQRSEVFTEDNSEEFNNLNIKLDVLTKKTNDLEQIVKQLFRLLSELCQDNQSQASYTSGAVDIFGRTGQKSYR